MAWVLSVIKGLHSVITMENKVKDRRIIIILVMLIFLGCNEKLTQCLTPASKGHDKIIFLLRQLTSSDEAERFRAIEEAKKQIASMDINNIETTLTSLRKKNVSTLIFVLMEMRSEAIYKLSLIAKKAVENSEGSFPNIAYYYARVNPQKGLSELFRLYKEDIINHMSICKAIGEVGTQDALNFLITRVKEERKADKEIVTLLAGLQSYNRVINNEEIQFLLEQNLTRGEIILLSKLKTNFTQQSLTSLWKANNQKKTYAIEYVLSNPSANFETLQAIIKHELAAKRRDTVLQFMMSDNIQRTKDENIRKFRESIINSIQHFPLQKKK